MFNNEGMSVFDKKITGTKAYLGIIACLMYSIGIAVLAHSVSPIFSMLCYGTYVIAIVCFGKEALMSVKGLSADKLLATTILGILLDIVLVQFLMCNIVQPTIIKGLHIESFSNANTTQITKKITENSFWGEVWMIVGCCVIGPIVEELLYRVALFRVLYQKNKVLGHLGTALIFGLQHVFVATVYGRHPQELLLIGSYMVFSLILTKFYVRTKSPVPGILVHMLTNGMGVLCMIYYR